MSLHQPKAQRKESDELIKLKALKIKPIIKNPSQDNGDLQKFPVSSSTENENGVISGHESRLQIEYEESATDIYGTFASVNRHRSQSKTVSNGYEYENMLNLNSNWANSREESQAEIRNDLSHNQNDVSIDQSPNVRVLARHDNQFSRKHLEELENNIQLFSNEPSRIIDAKPTEIINSKLRNVKVEPLITPSFVDKEPNQKVVQIEETADKSDKSMVDKSNIEDLSFNDKSYNEQNSLARQNTRECEYNFLIVKVTFPGVQAEKDGIN